MMSGNRLLASLSLPQATLSALTRAGYENVRDISGKTAESLSKGFQYNISVVLTSFTSSHVELNIPLSAAHALFSTLKKISATEHPLTQSAASMTLRSRAFSTGCAPVDKLLGGGLARGYILELTGPPGCGKERISSGIVREFVDAKEGVLFVGKEITRGFAPS
jgi:RAD51-like protein 2